jgi:hypothetical protein
MEAGTLSVTGTVTVGVLTLTDGKLTEGTLTLGTVSTGIDTAGVVTAGVDTDGMLTPKVGSVRTGVVVVVVPATGGLSVTGGPRGDAVDPVVDLPSDGVNVFGTVVTTVSALCPTKVVDGKWSVRFA